MQRSDLAGCAVLLLGLAGAAGCSGLADDLAIERLPPPGFRVGVGGSAGGPVDPLDPDEVWRAGDQVAYRVVVDVGGAPETLTFGLRLQELPPARDPRAWPLPVPDPYSGFVRARAAVLTGRGEQFPNSEDANAMQWAWEYAATAPVRVWLEDHQSMLCDRVVELPVRAHVAQTHVTAGHAQTTLQLIRTLLEVDALHDKLLEVVRRPSAWSVLRNFGSVAVTLGFDYEQPIERSAVETPFGRVPAAWVYIRLRANGEAALHGRLQFTWCQSPLLLAGGVLQAEVWHPDDPTRRVHAQLATARRGRTATVQDRGDLGLHGLRVGMSAAEVEQAIGGSFDAERRPLSWSAGRAEIRRCQRPDLVVHCLLLDDRLLFAAYSAETVLVYAKERTPDSQQSSAMVGR